MREDAAQLHGVAHLQFDVLGTGRVAEMQAAGGGCLAEEDLALPGDGRAHHATQGAGPAGVLGAADQKNQAVMGQPADAVAHPPVAEHPHLGVVLVAQGHEVLLLDVCEHGGQPGLHHGTEHGRGPHGDHGAIHLEHEGVPAQVRARLLADQQRHVLALEDLLHVLGHEQFSGLEHPAAAAVQLIGGTVVLLEDAALHRGDAQHREDLPVGLVSGRDLLQQHQVVQLEELRLDEPGRRSLEQDRPLPLTTHELGERLGDAGVRLEIGMEHHDPDRGQLPAPGEGRGHPEHRDGVGAVDVSGRGPLQGPHGAALTGDIPGHQHQGVLHRIFGVGVTNVAMKRPEQGTRTHGEWKFPIGCRLHRSGATRHQREKHRKTPMNSCIFQGQAITSHCVEPPSRLYIQMFSWMHNGKAFPRKVSFEQVVHALHQLWNRKSDRQHVLHGMRNQDDPSGARPVSGARACPFGPRPVRGRADGPSRGCGPRRPRCSGSSRGQPSTVHQEHRLSDLRRRQRPA